MALSRKLFIGCGAVGCGLPLLTLGGGLFWAFSTFGGDANRYDEEQAAARREGIPLTGADLRPKTPVPDKKNAAPLIREAATLWPDGRRGKEEKVLKPLRKEGFTQVERTAAEAMLKKLAPVLALAREAAGREDCDLGYDFDEGAWLRMPELASFGMLARLLCSQAAIATTPEAAFTDIALAARLGTHAGKVPIFTGGLARTGVEAMAHQSFCQALARFGLAALPAARAALSGWGEAPPLTHYLGGEVVFYNITIQQFLSGKTALDAVVGKDVMKNITIQQFLSGKMTLADLQVLTGCGESEERGPRLPPVVGPVLVKAWGTRGVIYWRGAFKILRECGNDPVRAHEALLAYSKPWRGRDHDPQDILLAIHMPVYDHAIETTHIQPLTERRLRETALALLEAGGQSVQLPVDPFSAKGEPLKLRREGRGFTLWSVGPDRTDDGGVARDEKTKELKELVVRIPA
jgi:hypothetical protein